VDPDATDCHEILGTVQRPLSELEEVDLCPGNDALQSINASLR
jgi:2-oxoglutarate ferredoxin oxidoreductase subunit beta